ncbi:hypothetical protein ACRAWF_15785 [Streptomyces sp. L7]
MGRHRRSAAGRAATSRATGGFTETHGSYTSGYDPHDSLRLERPGRRFRLERSRRLDDRHGALSAPGGPAGVPPEPPGSHESPASEHTTRHLRSPKPGCGPVRLKADTRLKSEAYLFATEEDYAVVFPEAAGAPSRGDGSRPGRGRRRKRKSVTPVKAGLLGSAAAVAIGTVAVAAGAVPGLDNYKLGGGGNSDKVQAAGSPSNSATEQGGTSGSAESRDSGSSTSRDANARPPRRQLPTKSATAPATKAPAEEAGGHPDRGADDLDPLGQAHPGTDAVRRHAGDGLRGRPPPRPRCSSSSTSSAPSPAAPRWPPTAR